LNSQNNLPRRDPLGKPRKSYSLDRIIMIFAPLTRSIDLAQKMKTLDCIRAPDGIRLKPFGFSFPLKNPSSIYDDEKV
jgi:hypothetical protein